MVIGEQGAELEVASYDKEVAAALGLAGPVTVQGIYAGEVPLDNLDHWFQLEHTTAHWRDRIVRILDEKEGRLLIAHDDPHPDLEFVVTDRWMGWGEHRGWVDPTTVKPVTFNLRLADEEIANRLWRLQLPKQLSWHYRFRSGRGCWEGSLGTVSAMRVWVHHEPDGCFEWIWYRYLDLSPHVRWLVVLGEERQGVGTVPFGTVDDARLAMRDVGASELANVLLHQRVDLVGELTAEGPSSWAVVLFRHGLPFGRIFYRDGAFWAWRFARSQSWNPSPDRFGGAHETLEAAAKALLSQVVR